MRLCCLSVDLDEIHHYHALHGLPLPLGPSKTAVYDVALSRWEAFARSHELPLTFFVVGADLRRPANAVRLRTLADAGHELGNHTLDHCYDLTRLAPAAMEHQVQAATTAIHAATGTQVLGFRAPGYTLSDRLVRVLMASGIRYDSSVFPSPAYYAAKLLALGALKLGGKRSQSIVGAPTVLLAPTRPYRLGAAYYRRGSGLLELPIQVTRRLRLPYIGTALTLAGPDVARRLTRGVIGEPVVNLELHGIDLLDAADGLSDLLGKQPDVRVSQSRKLDALSAAVLELRRAGYAFVRLDEAAARWQKTC
jgi:peptidoglycan/xylan/chitin deacetylase (PgdA/CDA1 family)